MPVLTDVSLVEKFLASLTIGEPLRHDALTVVPLLSSDASGPGWLTLDQADGSVQITELSEGGSVPHLVVVKNIEFSPAHESAPRSKMP